MAIQTLHRSTMPSGVPAGHPLSRTLLDALYNHMSIPVTYYPVIEEGDYDDFKTCVFRVCACRVCEVALEDMVHECNEHHISLQHQNRQWKYSDRQCVTTVEMRFEAHNDCSEDVQEFFRYLANKYGFVYNRITISRPRPTPLSIGGGGFHDSYMYERRGVELEVEILWPYWT